MVKIRLKRCGRKNRPFFRICVMDARTRRDGRPIEIVGFYDPIQANKTRKMSMKPDRVSYWLGEGAQPTRTVRSIMKRLGYDFTIGDWKEGARAEADATATQPEPEPEPEPEPKSEPVAQEQAE